MKLLLTFTLFVFFFKPKAQNNCSINEFANINWQTANKHASTFTCILKPDSNMALGTKTLKYIGQLSAENKIIYSSFDSLFFITATNISFGVIETEIEENIKAISEIIALTKPNTSTFIKLKYNLEEPKEKNNKMFVYLNDKCTKKNALNLLKIYQDSNYVDSLIYISKAQAKADYLKDGAEDFAEIILNNPLPASVTLYFKKQYSNAELMNKIATKLKKKWQIESVYFEINGGTVKNQATLDLFYNTNFIIQLISY